MAKVSRTEAQQTQSQGSALTWDESEINVSSIARINILILVHCFCEGGNI